MMKLDNVSTFELQFIKMETKKFTQIGKTSIILVVGIFLGILIFIVALHRNELENYSIAPVGIILAFVLLFLYKLDIIIDNEYVRFRFGIGIGGKYKLSNIKSAKAVTNSWFSGYGMRWLPLNGWLYNVSGNKAVELEFYNRTGVIRIGTDKPEEVVAYINSKLTQH